MLAGLYRCHIAIESSETKHRSILLPSSLICTIFYPNHSSLSYRRVHFEVVTECKTAVRERVSFRLAIVDIEENSVIMAMMIHEKAYTSRALSATRLAVVHQDSSVPTIFFIRSLVYSSTVLYIAQKSSPTGCSAR